MQCPHCRDEKNGDFPGIGVRCRSCGKSFYAGRNGIGYVTAPWLPLLRWLIIPTVGGAFVWGLSRFLWEGDYVQAGKIVFTAATGLTLAYIIHRYQKLPEV